MRAPRAGAGLPALALLAALGAAVLAPRPVLAVEGQLEPGIVLPGGEGLLPIALRDAAGAPFLARADELALKVGGRQIESLAIAGFAPAPGGEPCHMLLLLDLPALDEPTRRAWAERLARFLAPAPGVTRALAVAAAGQATWVKPGGPAPTAAALAERLDAQAAAGKPERLWDSLLDALAGLSGGGGLPPRRVLILVSDGLEATPSRHPLASCLEAAQLARVPVYVLALPAATAGGAAGGRRLAELAAGSGGRLLVAESGRVEETWQALTSGVSAVQALRFRAPASPRPEPLQLEIGGAGGGLLTGSLAPRTRVAAGADSRLLFLFALPLLAVAGAVIVWHRRRGVGRLSFVENGIRRERVLPHRGLSIGSDPGSDLLVAHPHVSRQHAVLRLQRGQVLLTDLRSTNGTAVNGRPVRSQVLRDGDRILLGGSVEIVFARRRGRASTQ